MLERLRVDLVSAARALRDAPATAAAAVLTLAVAVGLNLAMFGLIDRALLSPPSGVAEPDRVFTLAYEPPGDETRRARMTTTSYVTFEAIRDQVPAAADAAAWQRVTSSAVIDAAQIQTDAMLVSGSYFELLGARPALGRTISREDDVVSGGSAPIVLSHAFWMGAFGADPGALGKRVTVRGIEFTVAGVMPAGFSGHSTARVDVWVPFHAAMQQTPGWDTNPLRRFLSIVVRLRAGEHPSAAEAQAGAAIDRRVTLSPVVGAEVAATEQRIAYWLAGVSILVLVIGLANTATLLLVRGARRRRDLAIRTSLGATRARLFVQLLIEAALLAAVAIAAALALSYWFDEAVRRLLLPSVVESTGVTRRILGGAALAGLFALLAAAVVNAVQLPASFQPGDLAGASRGRSRRRTHAALLVLQTTLSVALLAGAGVFGRSLYNLGAQDFGMRLDGVLLVQFDQGPAPIPGRDELFRASLERVRSLPGVELATLVQMIPFTGFHVLPVGVPGQSSSPNVNGQLPYLLAATPELLQILDVRIVEGRRFVEADERGAPVVIVNETMARTTWPGERALGKCIRIGFDPSFDPFTAAGPPGPPVSVPCREVIGVVRDIRQRSVVASGAEAHLMQYFVPFAQVPRPPGGEGGPGISGLLLRASAGPEALADPIRRLVVGGRRDVPFLQVRPYAELLQRQMRPWRLGTMLLTLFAGLALGVAAMGLYAAFAHAVGERRREMAIRIAVGAEPLRVVVMILREAAGLAAAGVLGGCLLTIAGGRWLRAMLFGTAPYDPLVLGSAAALMLVVAALATVAPARSAARTDPNALLRTD